MIQASIAVLALTALLIMSLRANQRFLPERRLPMQWSFSGSVNWTAPRWMALSFTPLLAGIILATAVTGTIVAEPRPGQKGMEIPVIAVLALGFVAAHALHLWLIEKYVNANGR